MSTRNSFTASTPGPVLVDVTSHIGAVKVTVDPRLRNAQVFVETAEDSGRFADAVHATTCTQERWQGGSRMNVEVPEVPVVTRRTGDATFNFGNNVVFGSGSSGLQMTADGDVVMGGRTIVSDGRVVADKGTVVSGPAATITVTVRVPGNCAVLLSSTSAQLTVTGDLAAVSVKNISGDVEVKGSAGFLTVTTVSGNVMAERVDHQVTHTSVSGSLEVDAYHGSAFAAKTVSGNVRVTASALATGTMAATSVSGDIVTVNARHLNPRTSSACGRTRNL